MAARTRDGACGRPASCEAPAPFDTAHRNVGDVLRVRVAQLEALEVHGYLHDPCAQGHGSAVPGTVGEAACREVRDRFGLHHPHVGTRRDGGEIARRRDEFLVAEPFGERDHVAARQPVGLHRCARPVAQCADLRHDIGGRQSGELGVLGPPGTVRQMAVAAARLAGVGGHDPGQRRVFVGKPVDRHVGMPDLRPRRGDRRARYGRRFRRLGRLHGGGCRAPGECPVGERRSANAHWQDDDEAGEQDSPATGIVPHDPNLLIVHVPRCCMDCVAGPHVSRPPLLRAGAAVPPPRGVRPRCGAGRPPRRERTRRVRKLR